MEIVFCSNFLAIVSLQYAHIWRHISTSTLSFCRNIGLWLKSISEMHKWTLPFHNCITCCMTTPQKLACWLLHSDAACGQDYCKPPGRVQKARYLFVPCCMADVMPMSTTATPPYLECPKSNAQRHGLLATVTSCQQLARSSLSNTDCLRHSLCDATAVFSRSVTATQWMKALWRNGWMVV